VGQGSETNVPVTERDFTRLKKEEIRKKFDQIYEKLYGRTYPDSAVEFINFKVRASLPERLFKFSKLDKKGQGLKAAVKGQRPAYSGIVKDFIPYTVYDRYKLFPNAKFKGPAIIEEKESTLIVGEDAAVSVDDYGFLWVEFASARGAKPKAKAAKPKVQEVKRKAKPAKTKVQALAAKVTAAKPKAKTAKPKIKVKSVKPKATKPKPKVKSTRRKR
jgi:hypothetical protein